MNTTSRRDRRFDSPAPDSVRAARHFVGDALRDLGMQAIIHEAALLTSELATNVVVHARTPFTVTVVAADDGWVRVEVHDEREELPVLGNRASLDLGGRGLMLVDALAGGWGTHLEDGGGKVVWFELAGGRGAVSRDRNQAEDSTAP